MRRMCGFWLLFALTCFVYLAFLVFGAGCSGVPGVVQGPPESSISPIRFTLRGHVDGTFQGTYHADPIGNTIPPIPLTALFKVLGDVTVVAQPFIPYVIYDLRAGAIIEPLPGQEQAAQQTLDQGLVVIRRAGIAGRMNAPGSIRAQKAIRDLVKPAGK